MGDADMFAVTQIQADQDGDDMYISLATAVAVRKCKVVQKKEKLKLVINDLKKLRENVKLEKEETHKINKEREEVAYQETLKTTNIKGVGESRSSLETVLCDLNNKVSQEKAERKKKKDEFNAAVKGSYDTWDSYLKVYNEFPWVKKREALKIELKKSYIELRMTKLDIEDIKRKDKLIKEITQKRFHIWAVGLAKSYFELQKKDTEVNLLLEQIRELKQQMDDLKSGKSITEKPNISQNVQKPLPSQEFQRMQTDQTSKVLQFKMPQIHVTSPPYEGHSVQTKGSLFSWADLFQSTGKFLGLPNKTQNKSVEEAKRVIDYTPNKTAPTRSNLVLNPSSKPPTVQIKPGDQRGEKRKHSVDKPEKQTTLPIKKNVCNKPTQNKIDVDLLVAKAGDATKSVTEQSIENFKEKTNFIERTKKNHNKENVNISDNSSSLSEIKAYIMSRTSNKSNNTSTLYQKPIQTQSSKQAEIQQKSEELQKRIPTEEHKLSLSHYQQIMANYQPKAQLNKPESNVEKDLFANESSERQPESVAMMDPTSPPDIIPVENNSQPSSQTNMMQSASVKIPSQSLSDYISPAELDEAAKLAYQRIAAESPGYNPPRGQECMSPRQPGAEMNEVTVRSEYFSKMVTSQSSLNTPTNQEIYQPSMYSPPGDYQFSPGQMSSVLSPPPGNLGRFDLEKNSPGKFSSFSFNKPANTDEKKSSDEGFSFSFGSKNKVSSILSLF